MREEKNRSGGERAIMLPGFSRTPSLFLPVVVVAAAAALVIDGEYYTKTRRERNVCESLCNSRARETQVQ